MEPANHIITEIHYREATIVDLPRITQICVEGMPDDPTFDYIWKKRKQYPSDNYYFWMLSLKSELFNPRFTILVAYIHGRDDVSISDGEDVSEAEEIVIAFAVWERNGNSKAAKCRFKTQNTLRNRAHGFLTSLETRLIRSYHQRRDVAPARQRQFQTVMNHVHKQYWEKKYPDNFHLDLLCTHPGFRRRGAGTLLTKWGLERAKDEGAFVGVESSPMGFELYKKLGFKLEKVFTVRVDGEEERIEVRVMTNTQFGREKPGRGIKVA